MNFSISQKDKEILFSILKRYQNDFSFYAFGSRVAGGAKKYSDLDLAVKKKRESEIFKLKKDLEDSDLSITVDIVDLDSVDKSFKDIIDSEKIEILI